VTQGTKNYRVMEIKKEIVMILLQQVFILLKFASLFNLPISKMINLAH